jgi:hypothetical protein
MSTQHTPGPWKAVYIGCNDWDLIGPVTQEDWTLAAAAPDLLQALDFLIGAAEQHSMSNDPEIKQELNTARAAIAKVTGETK